MQTRARMFWGLALIVMGALFLAERMGVLPFGLNFGMFLFGVPAALFLLVFVSERRQWWALIPASALAGLTCLVFNSEAHWMADEQAASLFLFSIAAPFLLIFAFDRRQWWALIPGGVMTVIAFMPTIADSNLSGEFIGGMFFLGLAAVFALVRLATLGDPRMAWAWWPAAILGGFGAFIMLMGTVASQFFWPVVLIGLGLLVLARGYLPRSHSH
ncbi:MAG TPA: hypothetical protein VFF59_03630 [Anaerolineae bacterium]|nr:hypothetical protein [Anaerolineae bacterium]